MVLFREFQIACRPLLFLEDARHQIRKLDAAGSRSRLDLLMHERLRHAVEVLVDGDVIVDIDARLVVAGELVAADRQGLLAYRGCPCPWW